MSFGKYAGSLLAAAALVGAGWFVRDKGLLGEIPNAPASTTPVRYTGAELESLSNGVYQLTTFGEGRSNMRHYLLRAKIGEVPKTQEFANDAVHARQVIMDTLVEKVLGEGVELPTKSAAFPKVSLTELREFPGLYILLVESPTGDVKENYMMHPNSVEGLGATDLTSLRFKKIDENLSEEDLVGRIRTAIASLEYDSSRLMKLK